MEEPVAYLRASCGHLGLWSNSGPQTPLVTPAHPKSGIAAHMIWAQSDLVLNISLYTDELCVLVEVT